MTIHPQDAPWLLCCYYCGHQVHDLEEIVWVNPVSRQATTGPKGMPHHVECAPSERFYDLPRPLASDLDSLHKYGVPDGLVDSIADSIRRVQSPEGEES